MPRSPARSSPRVRQLWTRVVATRRRARLAAVRVAAAIETETRLAETAVRAGEQPPAASG